MFFQESQAHEAESAKLKEDLTEKENQMKEQQIQMEGKSVAEMGSS